MAILQWVFLLPEPIPEVAAWSGLGFVTGVAVYAVYNCIKAPQDVPGPHTSSTETDPNDRKER